MSKLFHSAAWGWVFNEGGRILTVSYFGKNSPHGHAIRVYLLGLGKTFWL